mmetsp:Transcript_58103/g.184846  ORF Transcript_58103/g.184846 Transcript_58103/m.184846 type:complete len:256 (+) Transcript_58103:504-1271(+)
MHCRCLISLFGFPLTTRMAPAVAQSVSDFWSSDGPWGAVESVGRRVLPDHTRAEVLSCLSFGLENRQRTSVTGPTGEEAVLLWTLQREGARWQVASIVREDPLLGEDQGEGGDAAAPHPSLPPEAVVLSQLAALKAGDFECVARFSTPDLQKRFGQGQRFASALRAPAYRSLVWHSGSRILQLTMVDAGFALCTVAVTAGGKEGSMPGRPPPETGVFTWLLTLQTAGPWEGCWLTNSLSRDPLPLEQWSDQDFSA